MPSWIASRTTPRGEALSQSELDELRRNLSQLSTNSVERFYREAYAEGDSTTRDSLENFAAVELEMRAEPRDKISWLTVVAKTGVALESLGNSPLSES